MSININKQIRKLESDNFTEPPLNRPLFLNPFMLKSKNQLYNNIANSGGFGDNETNTNTNDNADSLLNKIKGFLAGSPLPDSRRRSPDSRRRSPSPDSRRRQSPDSRRRSSRRRVDPNYRDPDSDIIPTTPPTEAEIKEYVKSIRESDLKTETNFIKSTTFIKSDNLETKKNELELAKHVQSEVYQKPEDRRSIKGFKRIRELGNDENVIYKSIKGFKNEVIWGIRGTDAKEDWLVDAQIWAKKHEYPFPTGFMDRRFKKANLKYNEIRKQFPNATIIASGHSLGNAIGLEVLKNNKEDDNLLLYGFNGYHHSDYVEKDLNKHYTLETEGDFVSWLGNNKDTVIQLLENEEIKNKALGSLSAGLITIMGTYMYTLFLEKQMIEIENIFVDDEGEPLPDYIMDGIDRMINMNEFDNLLNRYQTVGDITETVRNFFINHFRRFLAATFTAVYGLFITEAHSASHFKPKNPKWIKKENKKENKKNLRYIKRAEL